MEIFSIPNWEQHVILLRTVATSLPPLRQPGHPSHPHVDQTTTRQQQQLPADCQVLYWLFDEIDFFHDLWLYDCNNWRPYKRTKFNKTSLSTDMQCCDELEVRMSGTAYFHQQDKVSPQNRDIFHLKMNTGRRIQKNAILFYIFFPVSFFES